MCDFFFKLFILICIADKNIGGISSFGRNIDVIIDCWYLYQSKRFQDIDHPMNLANFPLWNNNNEVCLWVLKRLIARNCCKSICIAAFTLEFTYGATYVCVASKRVARCVCTYNCTNTNVNPLSCQFRAFKRLSDT